MTVEKCQFGDDTRMMLSKIEKRYETNFEKVWDKLDEIERRLIYRLPLWATFAFAFLTGAIGWLVNGCGG